MKLSWVLGLRWRKKRRRLWVVREEGRRPRGWVWCGREAKEQRLLEPLEREGSSFCFLWEW